MITRTAYDYQPAGWQSDYANSVSSIQELLDYLQLEISKLPYSISDQLDFPLRVPWAYIRQMRAQDPMDPLLRQVLPLLEEQNVSTGFSQDPVGDRHAEVCPGLIHKYQGRVLLVTTGACAVHCRYCFRRHFPYTASNPLKRELNNALGYIQSDTSIKEVILSGGDPLSLSDERLASLVSRLERIPHVETLRIHTRLPVVLPSRIDPQLLNWLSATSLKTVMVLHCNHANEISDELRQACLALRQRGVTLLNQSVLLSGVNDDVSSLAALSHALFNAHILPYYLHLLDRVEGAAHYEVSEEKALAMMQGLRSQLPGYLVPSLVREVAGMDSKQPVI